MCSVVFWSSSVFAINFCIPYSVLIFLNLAFHLVECMRLEFSERLIQRAE